MTTDDGRRTTDDRRKIVVVPHPVVSGPSSVAPQLVVCRLVSVVDKDRLRAFLQRDRLWSAYALGDLEPGLFEACDWAVAEAEGRDVAVGLLFRPLELMGCTLIGGADGIAAILDAVLTPERAHFTVLPEHEAVVAARYTLGHVDRMLRMVVDVVSFRPRALTPTPSPTGRGEPTLPPSPTGRGEADLLPLPVGEGWGEGPIPRRVTLADLERVNALYAGGETPDAFAPFQIEQGVFYAVERDGAFIAAAGTHLVAPGEGVAAVGNVYTAQAWRGQGLAQRCTSAVVQACFALGCRDVVLNVNVTNRAAIAAYEKLGFRPHCEFLEVTGTRRG